MYRFRLPIMVCIALLCGAGATAGTAVSQLEELTVTAEKKATDLQETPIAVTALTGESLRESGIRATDDLQLKTPNLVFGGAASSGFAFIRGVGTDVETTGADPSIAVYVDDVYRARPRDLATDLLDVNRVEILRGPQGTLYGRNATGGAIKIISNLPEEEPFASIDASVGKYDAYTVETVLNGPLGTDTVLGRLALQVSNHTGYRDNLSPDGASDLDDEDSVIARASVRFLPADNWEFNVVADFFSDERNGFALVSNEEFASISEDAQSVLDEGGMVGDADNHIVYHDFTPGFKSEERGIWGKAVWDKSENTQMSWLLGFRNSDGNQPIDIDTTQLELGGVNQMTDADSISFDYLINFESERYSVTGGFSYFGEEMDEDTAVMAPTFNNPFFGTVITKIAQTIEYEGDAYAVFAQASYDINDRLRLTGGLRWSYEEKEFRNDTVIEVVDIIPPFGAPPAMGEDDWSDVSPRFVIDYALDDDTFMYGSITNGFKSGGFNANADEGLVALGLVNFEPEDIWAYEFGIKSTYNDWLQSNIAIFYYKFDDIQVQTSPESAQIPAVQNAGEADVYGVEADFKALIGDSSLLNLSVAWLDAEFTDGTAIDFAGVEQDLDGNKLPRAPTWTVIAGYQYEKQIAPDLLLVPRIDYTHRSKMEFNPFSFPNTGQEEYGIVQAAVGIEDTDGRWSVEAFFRNLTDEVYFTSGTIATNGLSMAFSQGAPRTYGIRFRIRTE